MGRGGGRGGYKIHHRLTSATRRLWYRSLLNMEIVKDFFWLPRDFLPALSVAPGLNSQWDHHWRGEQCLSLLGRAKWKEPPVCRGWRPVSRRRGSWRLRDTPGISRCLNTPLWPLIRCRRVAVEAWHGQSAVMLSPGISSSFYLFSVSLWYRPCSDILFTLSFCLYPRRRWLGSIVGLEFRCVSLTAFERERTCVVGTTDRCYFFF